MEKFIDFVSGKVHASHGKVQSLCDWRSSSLRDGCLCVGESFIKIGILFLG